MPFAGYSKEIKMETSAYKTVGGGFIRPEKTDFVLKKVEALSDFMALKDRWEGLLSQSANESIFLTWEWVYHWWLVYKENRDLFILTVEDEEGNLLGIAPLLSHKVLSPVGTLKLLEFLGTGESKKDKVCSEFLDFIVHKERKEEVTKVMFEYLLNNISCWDILNLESLLDDSNLLRYISVQKNARLQLWKTSNNGCGYNYSVLSGDWDTYINGRGKHRKSLRQARKNIMKYGNIGVRICDDETSLSEDIRSFIRLHQLRWNSLGKPGCFSSRKFTQFHQGLAHSLLKKGRLFLQLLEINGKPEVCEYSFEYNRRLFIYQSGFNPQLARNISIGHLSMSYLVENAFVKGIKEIELLRGGESHKERWARDKRLVFNIVIARKNLKGYLYIVIRMSLEKFKHLIKGMIGKIRRTQ